MEKKNIGIIVGSLRKESFTKKIANNLIQLFPENYEAKIMDISGLEMYNQDLDDENRAPQAWNDLREKIKATDGFVFVTPEYNRSVPAVLKNALDVGSRPFGENAWDGKPSAVVSASPGAISGFGANHHLRQVLVFLNMPTLAQPEVYLASVHKLLDKQGGLKEEGTKDFLQSFVDAFVQWTDRNAK